MSLSVLLSVYKKEKVEYLEECLKSIYDDQIVKPNEIILVKDGVLSKELDMTIENWKEKLGDVLQIVPLNRNEGLAKALNEGLKFCSGDYIARIDTDDIALPERFKIQLEFMKLNDIDMSSSNAILINNTGSIVGKKNIDKNITYESLLKSCEIIHPACMFKGDFFERFGNYNPEFKKSQDYDLWLRSTKNGAKIKNITKELIKFRISNDLISRRKDEQKYNISIKKQHLEGYNYYISIVPNILIQIMPILILDILLKIKSYKGTE